MSVRWYVARRALWAVLVTYLVLSLAFAAVALPADPNKALVRFGAAVGGGDPQEAVDAYEAARNQDRPLVDRYVGWMVGMATLDWGFSYTQREPVAAIIGRRVLNTLLYVVPAVLLALVGGVALGWFAARRRGRRVASGLSLAAYLGLAVPNFLLAQLGILYAHQYFDVRLTVRPQETLLGDGVVTLVFAGVTLGVTLLAGQMRFARAEVLEFVATDFVKVVRAKGAGPRAVARHVLRNAAIPLLTFFVTDLVQVLILAIYVIEAVLGIPGVGELTLRAVDERDVAVVMTTTLLLVVFVVAANFVEDVSYAVLDPRIDLEE